MKYEEKIVAFIDILGFKNLVNDEKKMEIIAAILKMPYRLREGDMAKFLKKLFYPVQKFRSTLCVKHL
ncbi:hypothetical protein EII17_07480 [Clostridiales bacterium COT073_COT-073]|nr:hypothetical protein EII17_07480 [Clostridiales bacterium COT073_COT-073]